MARPKKPLRQITSKYGIASNPTTPTAELTIGEQIAAQRESMNRANLEQLQTLDKMHNAVLKRTQDFKNTITSLASDHARKQLPDFLSVGNHFITKDGVVASFDHTDQGFALQLSFQDRRIPDSSYYHGANTYESDIHSIRGHFWIFWSHFGSIGSIETGSSTDLSMGVDNMLEVITEKIQSLTIEELAKRNVYPTDKPVGYHHPYKRNVKAWARKMGFDATNNSHTLGYECCGNGEDSSPCRKLIVRGPQKGSDDLRGYVRYASQVNQFEEYLTKRDIMAGREDKVDGNCDIVTFTLGLVKPVEVA